MGAQQLCFLKFGRPLVDLLGNDFFRDAPREPGVYVFFGEGRRVLYVGQSKNLRLRLSYYKNARPEREPKRIIRLVHQTKGIEWQRCPTPVEAKIREVELIQEHRPRFNVQHALSRTYTFFGLAEGPDGFSLRVTLNEISRAGETFVGAFKNRGLCRRTLFAIARTLWSGRTPPESLYDFPMWVLDRSRVNELSFPDCPLEEITALLRGESSDFLRRTEACLQSLRDSFLKVLFERDLLLLAEFYELALRMRALREKAGSGAVLPQKELDRIPLTPPFPSPLNG